MDFDDRIELKHGELCNAWGRRFNEQKDSIPAWIFSFRDSQICRILDEHFSPFN
jgi:hypothetical protein